MQHGLGCRSHQLQSGYEQGGGVQSLGGGVAQDPSWSRRPLLVSALRIESVRVSDIGCLP